MLIGSFARADGLIMPNSITLAGKAAFLRAALRDESLSLYAGLALGASSLTALEGDITEPTIGTNGYQRIQIPTSNVGWTAIANTDTQAGLICQTLVWTAAGGPFTTQVNRLALFLAATRDPTRSIFSLGSALLADLTVTPDTPLNQRSFTYTIRL